MESWACTNCTLGSQHIQQNTKHFNSNTERAPYKVSGHWHLSTIDHNWWGGGSARKDTTHQWNWVEHNSYHPPQQSHGSGVNIFLCCRNQSQCSQLTMSSGLWKFSHCGMSTLVGHWYHWGISNCWSWTFLFDLFFFCFKEFLLSTCFHILLPVAFVSK